jgi:hypothetical protein
MAPIPFEIWFNQVDGAYRYITPLSLKSRFYVTTEQKIRGTSLKALQIDTPNPITVDMATDTCIPVEIKDVMSDSGGNAQRLSFSCTGNLYQLVRVIRYHQFMQRDATSIRNLINAADPSQLMNFTYEQAVDWANGIFEPEMAFNVQNSDIEWVLRKMLSTPSAATALGLTGTKYIISLDPLGMTKMNATDLLGSNLTGRLLMKIRDSQAPPTSTDAIVATSAQPASSAPPAQPTSPTANVRLSAAHAELAQAERRIVRLTADLEAAIANRDSLGREIRSLEG